MRFNALSVIFALLITTMAHQDNLPGPRTCAYCMKSTNEVKKLRSLSDSMIEACKSLHRRIDDEYQRLLAMQVARENDSSRQFLIHKSCYNAIYDATFRSQSAVQRAAEAAASADAQGMCFQLKITSLCTLCVSGCTQNAAKKRRFCLVFLVFFTAEFDTMDVDDADAQAFGTDAEHTGVQHHMLTRSAPLLIGMPRMSLFLCVF